jgi:hypothetical protein
MANNETSQKSQSHYIPFSKADIIEMCMVEGEFESSEKKSFGEFAQILSALFHYEYHDRLETLKQSYAPLNPDETTKKFKSSTKAERIEAEKNFVAMLSQVLDRANFKAMNREEISRSIAADPRLGMAMEVDLNAFEQLLIFHRECHTESVTSKRYFGLKKETFQRDYYNRLVLYLSFKDESPSGDKKAEMSIGDKEPGQAYLKLFSDVPVDGLEMLFPNAKMKMTILDKILIGGPAAIGGIIMLMNKLVPTILAVMALMTFWMGFSKDKGGIEKQTDYFVGLMVGGFAVYAYIRRQLDKIRSRRGKYLQTLLQNLYFRVFDNNAGVLHHLVGVAEDEDFKEAILAYYFLLTRNEPMTEQELDQKIESWFLEVHNTLLDFEVDDAVAKLERLQLAERDGDDRLTVKSLDESKHRIDWLWDNFFTYNNP